MAHSAASIVLLDEARAHRAQAEPEKVRERAQSGPAPRVDNRDDD